jgi:hypothetical protein
MTDGESGAGPKGQSFDSGEAPQTLAQLQNSGAEVVGSDGEKIGDLKTVGDADLVIGRTLRSDLHVPINRVGEVTSEGKVVLDVSADRAREGQWGGSSTDTAGGAEGFSDSARVEKGALGLREENSQETE